MSTPKERKQCQRTTTKGKRCQNQAVEGNTCLLHWRMLWRWGKGLGPLPTWYPQELCRNPEGGVAE